METYDFRVKSVPFAYRRIYAPGKVIQMAGRSAHGLTLVISGALQISFQNGKTEVARKGDIILQRFGDVYRLEAISDSYRIHRHLLPDRGRKFCRSDAPRLSHLHLRASSPLP